MQKKMVLSMALVLVSLGLLCVRFLGHQPKAIADTFKEAADRPAVVIGLDRPMPSPDQSARLTTSLTEPIGLAADNGSEETVRNATRKDGTYIKVPSVHLRTYYLFMGLGSLSDLQDGFKEEYGLTDLEVEQLVDYSRIALQADIKFQAEMQASICAARSTYRSIEQFGTALNEYTLKADQNQESLARDAQKELGAALSSKIYAHILRQRPSEQVSVDFPILLTVQNRDLPKELERFCSVKAS